MARANDQVEFPGRHLRLAREHLPDVADRPHAADDDLVRGRLAVLASQRDALQYPLSSTDLDARRRFGQRRRLHSRSKRRVIEPQVFCR